MVQVRMNMKLLIVTVLCGVLFQDCEAKRGQKFLSLFNVIKFDNDACMSGDLNVKSNNPMMGTCYSDSDCRDGGGVASGNCASGFGVCCLFFTEESDDTIRRNNTYVRNPGYPSALSETGSRFSYTVEKTSCDICHIRLGFEAFSLRGPVGTLEVDGGKCTDTFVVSNSNLKVPVVCGENKGQHMYIDIGTECSDSMTMTISLQNDVAKNRMWDIKVSQIQCNSNMSPPPSCLQWHTDQTGQIKTFNFDTNEDTTHLANQDQEICFRPPTRRTCCIRYIRCSDALSISINQPSNNVLRNEINDDCEYDWIYADNFTPSCTVVQEYQRSSSVKMCGPNLNNIDFSLIDMDQMCDCTPDFRLLIHTDATADQNQDFRNRGICLNFSFIDC